MVARFRGSVQTGFSAAVREHISGAGADPRAGGILGHDFTVTLLFETTALAYPGVVVDDGLRADITDHVSTRLHGRDIDTLLGRPATCEAIAEHLATWYVRSARPGGPHHRLVSVTVTHGDGGHGEFRLPEAAEQPR
jgi:hypothetical protein